MLVPSCLTETAENLWSRAVVPNFLAPGTGYVEDNFSTDGGGGGLGLVSGRFTCITFIVHFIAIIITL